MACKSHKFSSISFLYLCHVYPDATICYLNYIATPEAKLTTSVPQRFHYDRGRATCGLAATLSRMLFSVSHPYDPVHASHFWTALFGASESLISPNHFLTIISLLSLFLPSNARSLSSSHTFSSFFLCFLYRILSLIEDFSNINASFAGGAYVALNDSIVSLSPQTLNMSFGFSTTSSDGVLVRQGQLVGGVNSLDFAGVSLVAGKKYNWLPSNELYFHSCV